MNTEMASLIELDTVYGIEDCYVMLDIAMINAHNQRVAQKHFDRERENK